MASKFRKHLKRSAISPKKLTPEFVKKSEVLTKMSNASIAHRAVRQNSSIAKAKDWSDTKAMRANLREQHELQTSPSSKTAEKIRVRDKMDQGPARDALTAEINASTLKRGHIGIAVGALAVGGAAGSAVGAGGKVLSASDTAAAGIDRANRPVTAGRPGFFNQAETMQNNYDPSSGYGQSAARPGLIASVVNFFFGLFVAPKPHVNNQSRIATDTQRVPPPAQSVAPLDVPGQAAGGTYTIGTGKNGNWF